MEKAVPPIQVSSAKEATSPPPSSLSTSHSTPNLDPMGQHGGLGLSVSTSASHDCPLSYHIPSAWTTLYVRCCDRLYHIASASDHHITIALQDLLQWTRTQSTLAMSRKLRLEHRLRQYGNLYGTIAKSSSSASARALDLCSGASI